MWMWRNTVIRDFVDWLRKHNDEVEIGSDKSKSHDDKNSGDETHAHRQKRNQDKVAFYGMDLYSLYSSMDAVVEYLQKVSPEDAKEAKKCYSKFGSFAGAHHYGKHTALGLNKKLEEEVIKTLSDLHKNSEAYLKGVGGVIDDDELFYATQNAEIVKNAEEYYRKMYHGDERTWNLRDKHMTECIAKLLQFHRSKQPQKEHKIVVWAHNSHIGDARNTDKGKWREEWNVGQLILEKFGAENTFNIGFSTYHGTVTAATNWDTPAQLFLVNDGLEGSYEHLFYSVSRETKQKSFMVLSRSNSSKIQIAPELQNFLAVPRLERYIGVIYRPQSEVPSHYSSHISREYDSIIFIEKTHAIQPVDLTETWEKKRKLIDSEL